MLRTGAQGPLNLEQCMPPTVLFELRIHIFRVRVRNSNSTIGYDTLVEKDSSRTCRRHAPGCPRAVILIQTTDLVQLLPPNPDLVQQRVFLGLICFFPVDIGAQVFTLENFDDITEGTIEFLEGTVHEVRVTDVGNGTFGGRVGRCSCKTSEGERTKENGKFLVALHTPFLGSNLG